MCGVWCVVRGAYIYIPFDVCTHVLCMYSLYACLPACLLCACVCMCDMCAIYAMLCKNYTHALRTYTSTSLTLFSNGYVYINACSFYGFCWLYRLFLLLLLLLAFMIHKRCLPFLLSTKKGRFFFHRILCPVSIARVYCRRSLYSHTSFSIKLDMAWLGLALFWTHCILGDFISNDKQQATFLCQISLIHTLARTRTHKLMAKQSWWQ